MHYFINYIYHRFRYSIILVESNKKKLIRFYHKCFIFALALQKIIITVLSFSHRSVSGHRSRMFYSICINMVTNNIVSKTKIIALLFFLCVILLGLAAVVGGVFSNLANAANAILSSPSKIGITFNLYKNKDLFQCIIYWTCKKDFGNFI